MADSAKRKNDSGSRREENYLNNPLVDVFGQENTSGTGRGQAKDRYDARDTDVDIEERDYRPVRTRRDGRLGCLGGMMYAVFIIGLSVILACVGWMAASDVLALNKQELTATVTLPEDIFSEEQRDVTDDDGKVTGKKTVKVADIEYVAEQLKNEGLIEYKWLFKLFSKLSDAAAKLDPGSYELSTRFDYRALITNMQVGTESMLVTKLTFPEGYTMRQIFERLEENKVCSAEDLYDAAANYKYNFAFLEDAENGDASYLEGFLFPDTYDFYQGEQASSVINKFLSALHYKVTADMWKQCGNLNITFREAVTIASMIEKEAANDEERATIASVIYNRLNAGMNLGIDATILYEYPDYEGGLNIPENIRNADSPYNTNLYTGLPPTPICNPGIASINAALQPASTGYYYYALDTATGEHRFFTNINEFQAFTATQDYESYAGQ